MGSMWETRGMRRYELTKEQWERVKAVLPPEKTGKRGRPRKDDQKMLNGMLWIARSGAQWRELPEVYGPGSLCMPDLPNGGTMARWRLYSAHCPQMWIWKT